MLFCSEDLSFESVLCRCQNVLQSIPTPFVNPALDIFWSVIASSKILEFTHGPVSVNLNIRNSANVTYLTLVDINDCIAIWKVELIKVLEYYIMSCYNVSHWGFLIQTWLCDVMKCKYQVYSPSTFAEPRLQILILYQSKGKIITQNGRGCRW